MQTQTNPEDMQIFANLQNFPSNDENGDCYEFNNYEFIDRMLPKTKKENLDQNGKRKPLQAFQVDGMYNTPFKVQQFIKMARIFYKTSYDKRGILTLRNEQTERAISIDLNTDLFGYIKITTFKDANLHLLNLTVETKAPKYNTCLFKKIISKNLL